MSPWFRSRRSAVASVSGSPAIALTMNKRVHVMWSSQSLRMSTRSSSAALDQPVRADLYALLIDRDDWVSRDEAADAVGVPRSVAAFHLDKLAEADLVQVRFERPPGRGGPGAG